MSSTSQEHEDLAYARRAKAESKAADLLTHYMQRLWDAAGLTWNEDHDTEVREIVSLIIEASQS